MTLLSFEVLQEIVRELRSREPGARVFRALAPGWLTRFDFEELDRLLSISGVEHGSFSILCAEWGLQKRKMFSYVEPMTRLVSNARMLEEILIRQRSLLVRHLQEKSPIIRIAWASIESQGIPVRDVVCFVSPPKSQATIPHADSHPILQIQLQGRKYWRLWSVVPKNSFETAESFAEINERFNELVRSDDRIEVELNPGDALFVPERQLHTASSANGYSLSLSFQMPDGYTGGQIQRPINFFDRFESEGMRDR